MKEVGRVGSTALAGLVGITRARLNQIVNGDPISIELAAHFGYKKINMARFEKVSK